MLNDFPYLASYEYLLLYYNNISTSNSSRKLQCERGRGMSIIQANVNLQRTIIYGGFKITKMDAV